MEVYDLHSWNIIDSIFLEMIQILLKLSLEVFIDFFSWHYLLLYEINSLKLLKEISYIILPAITHRKIMTRNFFSSSVLIPFHLLSSFHSICFDKVPTTKPSKSTSEGMMPISFNCYHFKWLPGLERVCINQKLGMLIFKDFHLWNYIT